MCAQANIFIGELLLKLHVKNKETLLAHNIRDEISKPD